MPYRTDSTAVQGIIEVDVTIDLDPFIETANALVTEVCVPLGYDGVRLELIERWLSAHFYAIRDPRAKTEQAGEVQESFWGKIDLGFNQTREGQMAMLLDTKGGLKALDANGGVKPGMFWGGTCLRYL